MLERTPNHNHPKNTAKESTCTPSPASLTPVTVRNLSYSSNGQTLLSNLSFEIPRATKTIIMGPNGAGKSLLIRLLHGLLSPTSGDILWNGLQTSTAIRKQQAMIFQRPVVLRRTTEANIRFVLTNLPRAEREARTQHILKNANLSSVAKTPARLLSGGEQQRLAIARAQATNPKILFLDEPTAALDPASTHAIENMIHAASANGTKIILITHDLGQARRLADDIVFLDRGHLAESTPAKKFFNNPCSAAAAAYLAGQLYLDPATSTDGKKKP